MNQRFLMVGFLISTAACASGQSSNVIDSSRAVENPIDIPPFSVSDVEQLSTNTRISSLCETEALKTLAGVTVEYSILTASSRWGFVWRADALTMNGRNGRIVCWLPKEAEPDGVIINSKFTDENDEPLPDNISE